MKLLAFTLAVAAALGGCANTGAGGMSRSSSTGVMGAGATSGGGGMRTEMNSRLCQVFRGYTDRGEQSVLMEACTRQLGAEQCNRCLSTGL